MGPARRRGRGALSNPVVAVRARLPRGRPHPPGPSPPRPPPRRQSPGTPAGHNACGGATFPARRRRRRRRNSDGKGARGKGASGGGARSRRVSSTSEDEPRCDCAGARGTARGRAAPQGVPSWRAEREQSWSPRQRLLASFPFPRERVRPRSGPSRPGFEPSSPPAHPRLSVRRRRACDPADGLAPRSRIPAPQRGDVSEGPGGRTGARDAASVRRFAEGACLALWF